MIAASGTRFDGLDLLALVALIVTLYLLGVLLNRRWESKVQPDIDRLLSDQAHGFGRITLSQASDAAGVYGVAMNDAMKGEPVFFKLMGEEQVWGDKDTPMPLPYYDWANEKPMPVVNW